MYLPELPDPAYPAPIASQRIVRCLAADMEETDKYADRLATVDDGRDLSYLDRLITKPWGSEFRVYEDDSTDVWCLFVAPDHRTSLHCHPNKLTTLLCLQGSGALTTCVGVQYALKPGVVLQIEPGAYHRSSAAPDAGLRLIEIEMPKDKFDLLRIEDDYRNVTDPYEDERHAPLATAQPDRIGVMPLALQPLIERHVGPRRSRLREQCTRGRYRFAIETREQLLEARTLIFAIELQRPTATTREVTVLTADRVAVATSNSPYLTIRKQQGGLSCHAL
jgi:mannose-6-phosphate isomerase-like protein (cupin superfamily)